MSLDNIISQSATTTFVRPSMFLVSANSALDGPILTESDELEGALLIKTSTLPSTTIGAIEIPYKGRKAYIPGNRALPPDIAMTIIYHRDHDYHASFNAWMNSFQRPADTVVMERYATNGDLHANTMNIVVRDPHGTGGDAGGPLHRYKLYGCIPTQVAAVELSSETTDTLLEFSVTIQYSYHRFSADGAAISD